jgi:uncharacterized protein YjiS (DUF1127 family)
MTSPLTLIALWRQRVTYRRALRRMLEAHSHLISDIGLTEAEARAEANRPFWHA